MDQNDKAVWNQYTIPPEAWRNPVSWFPRKKADAIISELLPLIYQKYKDNSELKTVIQRALYWYRLANNGSTGIEDGIILTQTGIELISYTHTITEKKLMLAKKFKGLKASDQFRALFSSIGIPLETHSNLKDLLHSHTKNWADGPHLFTDVRNSLVHPESKHTFSDEVLFEVWRIGLWYLELSILGILDYNGEYGNRLNRECGLNKVENVPWNSKS